IPSTVTTIPKGAFIGAYHFTALILDRSLEFIAYNAFSGCDNLTDIYFYGCSSLNGPNFNSDDGNEPIYNATWHYIQEGEFGEHILLLSNSSVGDVDSVATVMVPGDKRGEKVHLTVVNGNIFDGDVDITKYSSALNYSSAVVDLGHLHAGSYDATASYTDENNNKYTVSGQIDAGKWSPHLDVKDVNIFLGQTAVIEANLDENAYGDINFTINGETYTRYPREGKATLRIDGFPVSEYPIEVEYSGDDNYLSETVTAKLFVNEKLNVVTPKTATITYGNAAPTEVEVSYTDADGNVLAGLPEKLPCTSSYTQYGNVGEYTITLDADKIEQQGIFDAYEQEGYGFSEFDFTATSTLTVNQKPLFVTWNNVTEFTYDGKQKTIGGAVSGFVLADIGKVNVSFQDNSKVDAGTYTAQVVLTGDKAGNYCINDADKSKDWKINKADLTVTANQQDLTYNGAIQGPGDATYSDAAELAEVITVSGLKGDDKVTSVIIDGQGQNKGDYDLVPSGATVNGNSAGNNYNVTYVNGVLKISPKAVTITANNSTKVYDGTPLTNGSFTHSALETGDTHDFTVVMTQGSTITDAGACRNEIATVDGVSVTPGTATPVGNYTVTAANGTLEIIRATAAVTISGHNNTSVFDGGEHSVSGYDFASTNPLYTKSYFTFSGNALAKRTDFGKTNMGLLDSQFININGNFEVTFNVTDGYQQIIAKQINDSTDITLDGSTYDGTAKTLAVKLGDKVLAAGADYSVSIKNADGAAVSEIIGAGEYTVTVTGKGNYTGSVTKTVTVAPAEITITADDKESNHGTDLLPLTYKVGGAYVNGDELGITLNADIDN
ncbi:MAG: Ig-like domain repeat protein, partial [Eubacterium sp.]|nr:Ig-like domain repeat protein [Eubacterium sp.]